MPDEIKVAITDDHPLIADGIAKVVGRTDGFSFVWSATSALECFKKLDIIRPEIMILDIDLPDSSGLQILSELKSKDNPPKVIMLSLHEEIPIIQSALKAGASGYLLKSSDPLQIQEALKLVSKGQKYFSTEVTELMLMAKEEGGINQSDLAKYESLTKREKEVLEMIVEGLSNNEIAEKSFISKRTEETHRGNLMQKLNLKNTVELVKFVLHNKL